jgi:hypothetical protein
MTTAGITTKVRVDVEEIESLKQNPFVFRSGLCPNQSNYKATSKTPYQQRRRYFIRARNAGSKYFHTRKRLAMRQQSAHDPRYE